jgi:hypothetical protein
MLLVGNPGEIFQQLGSVKRERKRICITIKMVVRMLHAMTLDQGLAPQGVAGPGRECSPGRGRPSRRPALHG